ncbi:MAG TPA: type II toxin-antitoxin system HigB family toxin [bacterium]|nr:type II toxin-antitoxin system HigB family toxin [bacterium]HQJ59467.1 type II toxin-antitoxin system HigB family toxin [bacterium]
MNIVALSTLKTFWTKHPDSQEQLKSWYAEMKRSSFKNPHEIKERYRSADAVGENRIVFNIKGNKYRLIVKFDYIRQKGFVRFIGTHDEYNKVNAEEI